MRTAYSMIVVLIVTSPAMATIDYAKQYNLPCGQCHVVSTGDGWDCLTGWDKNTRHLSNKPKPMWECSHSPGGPLKPFGEMFRANGYKMQ